MTQRTETELLEAAVKIADEIAKTDIDQRNVLYKMVAIQLSHRTQGHQANLFRQIAKVT